MKISRAYCERVETCAWPESRVRQGRGVRRSGTAVLTAVLGVHWRCEAAAPRSFTLVTGPRLGREASPGYKAPDQSMPRENPGRSRGDQLGVMQVHSLSH